MTPATLTALAASLRLISDPQLAAMDRQALTQAAAILEQVAGADAGCPVVCHGVELPGGGFHAFRKGIDDAQRRVDVCNVRRPIPPLAFVSPLIRQADHLAALTAQSGEATKALPALPKEIRSVLHQPWKAILDWHYAPEGVDSGKAAKAVDGAIEQTMIAYAQQAIADHLAAQSGEGVALYEALKGVVRVADRKTDEFDAARAAIAAYEAKRGGVR